MANTTIILIISYLIGSIPFGLVFSYLAGFGDIRKIGSGNIGTTNVLRTGSKKLALLTLIADSGKVVLAILLAHQIGYFQDYYVASAAFIGHLFPVWLKFKGGKGVASFLGLSLYLFPKIALIIAFSWVVTFFLTKISSLAAIVAAFVAIISLIATQEFGENLFLIIALIILILIKHKDNIIRILQGKESKFTSKKK